MNEFMNRNTTTLAIDTDARDMAGIARQLSDGALNALEELVIGLGAKEAFATIRARSEEMRGNHVTFLLQEFCIDNDVDVNDMRGVSRVRSLVVHRQQFIRQARRAGHNTVEIGRVLHRDHSTISHHIGKNGA